jgi:hypothetical protein
VEGTGRGLYDAGMCQEILELCAESCSQRSGFATEIGDIRRGRDIRQRSGIFVEVGIFDRDRGYS